MRMGFCEGGTLGRCGNVRRLSGRRDVAGVLPEVEGGWGDGGGVIVGDGEEGGEEGAGFLFEAEEVGGAEDAGEAEVVVVVGVEVVVSAGGEVLGAGDGGGGAREAVEVEHEVEGFLEIRLEGWAGAEVGDSLGVEGGSEGVDGAGGVEGEEPLDEVVGGFELIEGEGVDVAEVAAGVVGGGVGVEGEEGVRGHGVAPYLMAARRKFSMAAKSMRAKMVRPLARGEGSDHSFDLGSVWHSATPSCTKFNVFSFLGVGDIHAPLVHRFFVGRTPEEVSNQASHVGSCFRFKILQENIRVQAEQGSGVIQPGESKQIFAESRRGFAKE